MIEENLGKAKYDEKTLMQMQLIEIEKRLKGLDDIVGALDSLADDEDRVRKDHEKRIKTLEDARTRQIELNKQFHTHKATASTDLKLSFWERLLNNK